MLMRQRWRICFASSLSVGVTGRRRRPKSAFNFAQISTAVLSAHRTCKSPRCGGRTGHSGQTIAAPSPSQLNVFCLVDVHGQSRRSWSTVLSTVAHTPAVVYILYIRRSIPKTSAFWGPQFTYSSPRTTSPTQHITTRTNLDDTALNAEYWPHVWNSLPTDLGLCHTAAVDTRWIGRKRSCLGSAWIPQRIVNLCDCALEMLLLTYFLSPFRPHGTVFRILCVAGTSLKQFFNFCYESYS